MKHEIRFTIELNETDSALLVDALSERGESIASFSDAVVSREIRELVADRKADVGRILAMTGKIDEQVRIESAKLAEARKSPW